MALLELVSDERKPRGAQTGASAKPRARRRILPLQPAVALPPRAAPRRAVRGPANQSADAPATETITIVHQTPGRLRLRVSQLRHNPAFGDRAVAFLTQQPGVRAAHTTAACTSLTVIYDPEQVSTSHILAWLQQSVPPASEGHRVKVASRPSISAIVCGGAALGLGILGAPAALTTGLLAVSAVPIFARAIDGVVAERRLSADALDATAVSVLAMRGNIVAAALSAALIAGGEYIRALTARRSRGALVGMLASTGRHAWVLRGNRQVRVPAETLRAGDTVVFFPGDSIVVDGVVQRGSGLVDQKVLTGESDPVLKTAGEAVYAATVLTDGKLFVRAEKVGADTRASRIVQILEGAPTHDTRIANYAGRFADRLVLPTLGFAGAVLLLTGNVNRAVSIVVFDFATGIRVSAPTTVLASMTEAARRNVLIKGGRALEQLARVDTLVFDKTGTLTAGTPHVTDVQALADGISPAEVLALAAAAEQPLSHPAATAIVQAAEQRGIAIPDHGESHYTVGQGIDAEVRGHTILVGGQRFLAGKGVAIPTAAEGAARTAAEGGASSVYVARDGELIGSIAYADLPRSETVAVLERLRARGIKRTIMVTGDNEHVAKVVAKQVGIEEVVADVFPERKAEIVRELQAQGHVVGVIGDGINDSPALAYADVSFSLKAGTDVARETADVVLHGDLHGLPEAVDIAREAMRLIRQNLAIVAVPNSAGLVLAGLGLMNPVAATAINNGSNVAAALNGLRPLAARHTARDAW